MQAPRSGARAHSDREEGIGANRRVATVWGAAPSEASQSLSLRHSAVRQNGGSAGFTDAAGGVYSKVWLSLPLMPVCVGLPLAQPLFRLHGT